MTRQTLKYKDYVKLNEVMRHPLYGRIRVIYISEHGDKKIGRALCKLIDFNDTLKEFATLDLTRLKLKHFAPDIIDGGKK